MAFVVQKLRDRVKELRKAFADGQSIELTYKPHIFTAEQQAEFEANIEDDDKSPKERLVYLADYLCQSVIEWNATSTDGGPTIALQKEVLMGELFDFLMFVFNVIAEDKKAEKQKR